MRRTSLEDERRRLLQAHYAGAVPLELLKEEQGRLGRELVGIQRQLDACQADARLVRARVEQALDLLEDCYRLYVAAPDHLRKQLNRVFFERVLVNPLVDEEGRVVMPGGDGLRGEDDDGVRGAGDGAGGRCGRDGREMAVGRWQPSGGSQAGATGGAQDSLTKDLGGCAGREADGGRDEREHGEREADGAGGESTRRANALFCPCGGYRQWGQSGSAAQPVVRPAGQCRAAGSGVYHCPTRIARLDGRWATTVLG